MEPVNLNETEIALLRQAVDDERAAKATVQKLIDLVYRTRKLEGLFALSEDCTRLDPIETPKAQIKGLPDGPPRP